MIGKVIYENINGNTLVQVGERYYISGYVGTPKGQEMVIDERTAIEVPSTLLGMEIMTSKDPLKELQRIANFFKKL